MILRLTTAPTQWNGNPTGIIVDGDTRVPRELRSFILQALAEAQLAVMSPDGNRKAPDPGSLLKRFTLSTRIEHAETEVTIDTEELQLIEQCVATIFTEAVSIRVLGCIHESLGQTKQPRTVEG